MKMQAKGLDEVKKWIEDSCPKQVKKDVKASLKDGAQPILEKAKADAPQRSGKLAASLKIKAGGGRKGKGRISVSVRTDAKSLFQGETFYAGMQEFGWDQVPTFNIGTKIYSYPRGWQPTTHREGKHFMKRAIDEAASAAVEKFAESLKAKVEAMKVKK